MSPQLHGWDIHALKPGGGLVTLVTTMHQGRSSTRGVEQGARRAHGGRRAGVDAGLHGAGVLAVRLAG
jgi:hypothetical protein